MKTQNLKDKSKGDCGCKDKKKEQEPTPETNIGGDAPVKDEEETVQEAIIGNRPNDRK